MIITKYPDWVEAQLKIIDEAIAGIYKDVYQNYVNENISYNEAMRIKRNLYELTKPYVDEKVRLIQNSVPTYIVNG